MIGRRYDGEETTAVSRKERGVPDLEGDLARTPVMHVLDAFSAHRASGLLRIDGPTGETVQLWLRNGEIVLGARLGADGVPRPDLAHRLVTAGVVDVGQVRAAHRSVAATGVTIIEALLASGRLRQRQLGPHRTEVLLDAIATAVSWRQGSWRLHPAARVPHLPGMALAGLKAAAATRSDELGGAESFAGMVHGVPQLTPSRNYTGFDLSPEAWAVLSVVDGIRTTGEIAAACGLTDAEAVQVVAALAEESLLAPEMPRGRTPAGPPPVAPPPVGPPPAARPTDVAAVDDLQVITAAQIVETPEVPEPAPVAAGADAGRDSSSEGRNDTAALMRELSGLGLADEPNATPTIRQPRGAPPTPEADRKRRRFGR
jgi:hypothetical protein